MSVKAIGEDFATTDIVFAAALSEADFEVLDVEPSLEGEGLVVFLFDHSKALDGFRKKYVNGKVKVEPVSFQNALRRLKTMARNRS